RAPTAEPSCGSPPGVMPAHPGGREAGASSPNRKEPDMTIMHAPRLGPGRAGTIPQTRGGTGPPALRRVAFWLLALVLTSTMLGTTLPTPLYVIYQARWHLSAG